MKGVAQQAANVAQTSTQQDAAIRDRRRDNHRATARYRCPPATLGRLYVGDAHEYQRVWVMDVALVGLGFMLTRPVPAETPIVIHVRGRQTNTDYVLHAHVIHSTAQHADEWLVGCRLTEPLTDMVLDDLL